MTAGKRVLNLAVLSMSIGAALSYGRAARAAEPEQAPATAATAATTAPADDPETARLRADAAALWSAVARQDVSAVRDRLYAADDSERELATALSELLVAGQSLSSAARERFGAEGDTVGGQMVDPHDPSVIQQAAVTRQADDVATLAVSGSIRPLAFRRDAQGRWRLIVADYLDLKSDDGTRQELLPKQVSLLRRTAGVLKEGAQAVKAGQYPSVKDADAAIQKKLHEVMIEFRGGNAGTRPAQ